MLNALDRFLNRITMYKLVLYCLLIMALVAVVLGFFGIPPYSGLALLETLIVFLVACFWINTLFASFFKAPATADSAPITALILFFIMQPATHWQQLWMPLLMSLVAMGSKYIVAYKRKHLFNPAAFTAVVFGFTVNWVPFWWVANVYMLPLVAIAGFLIVKKIRRWPMVLMCFAGFFITFFLARGLENFSASLIEAFVSWPLVFFATIMLTEPSTTPPRQYQQLGYGLVAGLLLGNPLHLAGSVYATPEIVLVTLNFIAFFFAMKMKIKMIFKEKVLLAKDAYELVFTPEHRPSFIPGQYLEWSLPHMPQDQRGIRRYFTIASSPEEKEVRLGIKFNENPSSFKKHLLQLKAGDTMFAGNLAGDFLPPQSPQQKMVWVAGGIGITPFISIIRHLLATKQKRDIVLFYANKTEDDIAYKDVLMQAEKELGIKVVYLLDSGKCADENLCVEAGFMDEGLVKKYAPDFAERMYYLSGPNAMVESYKSLIKKLGVGIGRIKTDYFPGFA